ncbi:MAG: SMC-Scp complex subunit ScpB [Candidatus Colwellbacteria bacterium]|nr:SMC-Scp complex subunit ScpB [Candidatus Colwellbacteria bacterium]
MQNPNSLEAKLEAFLFLYGEPVKIERLAKELDAKKEDVEKAVEALEERLKEETKGLNLIKFDGQVQLTTKPALKPFLTKIVNEELDSPLTPASLETISIIAYLGPCSRALIEHIRGVNSTFILRNLMIRGLIERKPNPKRPNTFLYEVSFDFLRHIGINKPSELPDYEKYQRLKDETFNA